MARYFSNKIFISCIGLFWSLLSHFCSADADAGSECVRKQEKVMLDQGEVIPQHIIEKCLAKQIENRQMTGFLLAGWLMSRYGDTQTDFEQAIGYFEDAKRFAENGSYDHLYSVERLIDLKLSEATDIRAPGQAEGVFGLNDFQLDDNYRVEKFGEAIKEILVYLTNEDTFHVAIERLHSSPVSRASLSDMAFQEVISAIESNAPRFLNSSSEDSARNGQTYRLIGDFFDPEKGFRLAAVNLEKTVFYWSKAVEFEDGEAANNLGWLYTNGPRKDLVKATDLYLKAIAFGSDRIKVFAWNNLGVIRQKQPTLLKDGGFEFDLTGALEAYEQAIRLMEAEGNSAWSSWPYMNVGRLYYFPFKTIRQDYDKAARYFAEGVRAGGSEIFFLDLLAKYPGKVPTDIHETERWLLEQVKDGHSSALLDLAWQWENTGGKYADDKAYLYYSLCAAICDELEDVDRSENELEELKRLMTSADIQRLRAVILETQVALLQTENSKSPQPDRDAKQKYNKDFGRYYALLVGNSAYKYLPPLRTPRKDIEAIGKLLGSRFGFELIVVNDGDRRRITEELNFLKEKLQPADNLLIYYAGHGIQESDEGFWLPIDAQPDDDFNWISNSYIVRKLREIKANNILIVADSCFSGTLTRNANVLPEDTRIPTRIDEYDFLYRKKTRMALTSGGIEPVWDGGGAGGHSIFAASFLNALSGHVGPISATEIFQKVREPVLRNSLALGSPQTPILEAIPLSDHVDPDVVLVGKNPTE